jgi:hypothetical protein
MSIKYLPGAEHLTLSELVELGRRLGEDDLDRMRLRDSVRDAEFQVYWRLRAAMELVGELSEPWANDLARAAAGAERQARYPERGSAKRWGGSSRSHGRSLPEPGTLIIKPHSYQSWNVPEETLPDGTKRRVRYPTFRFVVVRRPSSLILLGDDEDYIYTNPSIAARKATGNTAEQGWAFFGFT